MTINFKNHLKFILLVFIFVSCGDSNNQEIEKSSSKLVEESCTSELIIDDLNWTNHKNVKNLEVKRNLNAVGLLKIPSIYSKCTGFLISENVVMTNNHCVESNSMAYDVNFYVRDNDNIIKKYICDELIMTNFSLDFSLLNCQGEPGKIHGYIELNNEMPNRYENIYVIQENCDYNTDPYCTVDKYLAEGEVDKVNAYSLSHNADTLGGSSGSPIFSKTTNKLIGLHNSGQEGQNGKSSINFGIPMAKIREFIIQKEPETHFKLPLTKKNNNSLQTSKNEVDVVKVEDIHPPKKENSECTQI